MIGVQQTASDGSCARARSIQMQRHDAAFARLAVLDIDGTLTDTVALHQAAMLAVMWSTFGPDYRTFSERFGCAFARDGVGARDARGNRHRGDYGCDIPTRRESGSHRLRRRWVVGSEDGRSAGTFISRHRDGRKCPCSFGPRWVGMETHSLDEVRENIDRLDRAIIRLMAERGSFVEQAARFKTTRADVEAPTRVEQVIAKVRAIATEAGLAPDVAEAAYRAMIAAFIEIEHSALKRVADRLRSPSPDTPDITETA